MFYLINVTPTNNLNNSVMINWHSDVKDSFVVVNNRKYIPTKSYLWSTKNIENTSKNTTFYTKERYINYCLIDNLEANTLYNYYISDGINKSNEFKFKTSGSNQFNLMMFSDLQCRFNQETHILYSLLKKRLNNNIDLTICSGDITDCGGIEEEWKYMLDKESFHDSIVTFAPGDHEYWADDTGSPYPMYDKPYAFNNIFHNPLNGVIENTNYYFNYNKTLFVCFDNDDSNHSKGEKFDKQIEWFKETIIPIRKNYDFLIVLMHKSINGSKIIDSSVYKNLHENFSNIFKLASVNLVLSGHDHIYSHKIENNVHYLDLGSSGNKRRPLDESFNLDEYVKLIDLKEKGYSCAGLVVVNNEKISIKVINTFDEIIEEFEINK